MEAQMKEAKASLEDEDDEHPQDVRHLRGLDSGIF